MIPRVIAIIPARGGSKGLPGKNVIDLGGTPLIGWSIAAAKGSRFKPRVIVSTDDENIARVSQELGAEVPFLRPDELSGDSANVEDALAYTLERLRAHGETFDLLMVLFPTHPFRSPEILDVLVDRCLTGVSQAMTAHRWFWSPSMWFLKGEQGLKPIPRTYCGEVVHEFNLGNVSWLRFPQGLKPKPKDYLLVDDEASLADIDTLEDLTRSRSLIESGKVRWNPAHPNSGSSVALPVLSDCASGKRITSSVRSLLCPEGIDLSLEELPNPQLLRDLLDANPLLRGQMVIGRGAERRNGSIYPSHPAASLDLSRPISIGLRVPGAGEGIWDPFTIEGILHYEPGTGWINVASGQRILGRQQFPSVYRWDGSFVLPPSIDASADFWSTMSEVRES